METSIIRNRRGETASDTSENCAEPLFGSAHTTNEFRLPQDSNGLFRQNCYSSSNIVEVHIALKSCTSQRETTDPYPSMVMEVAHAHESYTRLKDVVETKPFSLNTSKCVIFAGKIYPHSFQCFRSSRDYVRGHGAAALTVPEIGKLPANISTNLVFEILATEIFRHCPVIPPLRTQILNFPLEQVHAVVKHSPASSSTWP
jgi:hypothetical protein